jgi:hypothetical protein
MSPLTSSCMLTIITRAVHIAFILKYDVKPIKDKRQIVYLSKRLVDFFSRFENKLSFDDVMQLSS